MTEDELLLTGNKEIDDIRAKYLAGEKITKDELLTLMNFVYDMIKEWENWDWTPHPPVEELTS